MSTRNTFAVVSPTIASAANRSRLMRCRDADRHHRDAIGKPGARPCPQLGILHVTHVSPIGAGMEQVPDLQRDPDKPGNQRIPSQQRPQNRGLLGRRAAPRHDRQQRRQQ